MNALACCLLYIVFEVCYVIPRRRARRNEDEEEGGSTSGDSATSAQPRTNPQLQQGTFSNTTDQEKHILYRYVRVALDMDFPLVWQLSWPQDWYLEFSPAGPQVVQVQSTTTPNKMYAQNITRNSTTSVGSAIITSTPIKHSTTATQQSANTQPSSEPNGTDNISHNGKQRGSFWVYVRSDLQGDKNKNVGGTSLEHMIRAKNFIGNLIDQWLQK